MTAWRSSSTPARRASCCRRRAAIEKETILAALDKLEAGGSTAGAEGINSRTKRPSEHFIHAGVNRVILCTDGDFNVGVSDTGSLVRLAEEQAKKNIFLTILGFGIGNLNDEMLEQVCR